jgi:hypothetical protein
MIFISYSHKDAEWVSRIRVHLAPLIRQHLLEVWDDTRLVAGENWRAKIREAIDSASVAILLVSADFLASEFVASNELPPLLERAAVNGTKILPLIVSPSRFTRIPELAQFQAVNDPREPLIGLSRLGQEQVLDQLAQQVEMVLTVVQAADGPVSATAFGEELQTGTEQSTVSAQDPHTQVDAPPTRAAIKGETVEEDEDLESFQAWMRKVKR